MSNCKSNLITGHSLVDISDGENPGDTAECLMDLLAVDGDLEDDAVQIVKDAMKDKFIETLEVFEEVFVEVFNVIDSQDFYGDCEYSIIQVENQSTLSVAWAVGGHSE